MGHGREQSGKVAVFCPDGFWGRFHSWIFQTKTVKGEGSYQANIYPKKTSQEDKIGVIFV